MKIRIHALQLLSQHDLYIFSSHQNNMLHFLKIICGQNCLQ